MFNLGFTEILLLGILALIFIGPKQLPEIARTVGRMLNELKRAQSDLTSAITAETRQKFTPPSNEAPEPTHISTTENAVAAEGVSEAEKTEVKETNDEDKRST